MAAAIDKAFGITAKLKEGHGGIYEVAINDNVVYNKKEKGGRFPENEEIFREIRKYTNPHPERE
ncbi:hypothetical protein E3J38_04910 [candidate division TA06 bacterium]|uniref:SelT/SelW/SelH family protein n=1 Tax=candidate division TA06 bacterium TaxID=2250710 RepID=A0A523XNH2_UNCT6|nr:MAG: hypothetical protein E3J38_04910 [candidate division TA06 bacterium]